MKLLLISPSHFNPKGVLVKSRKLQFPTLTLPYLAALTPNDVKIKIVNDYIDEINFDIDFDLIGITFMTMQAVRAFQLGDEFRKRGKTVVMGGMGASMLPEETLQHSDSVVIGEAELVWKILIEDFKKGKLNKFYRSEKLSDLLDLPEPRFDLLDLNKYLFHAHLPVGATRLPEDVHTIVAFVRLPKSIDILRGLDLLMRLSERLKLLNHWGVKESSLLMTILPPIKNIP